MRTTLFLICLVVAVAGCGGDDTSSTTGAPAATTVPEAPATTAAPDTTADPATTAAPADTAPSDIGAGANPTITIAGFAYSGPSTVSVGDTVEVVNTDGVTHTWTSDEDGVFNLSLGGGASGTYTFEEPGEYSFFCTIHPSMTGSITVEG